MKQVTRNGVVDRKLTRDTFGKFSTPKSTKRIKQLGWVVVFIAILLIAAAYSKMQVAKATTVAGENFEAKIDGLRDQVVEDIRNCERAGFTEHDAPIILDTNKKMSIGTFMYQKKTVQYYYKKLYGKNLNGKEATLLALDEAQARELTKKVLFEEKEGWKNWYICSQKNDVAGRIKMINELEK